MMSFYSFPSLSWQLLVHLYHANEKVIFRVDQPHPLTMSALDTLSSSKVHTSMKELYIACVVTLMNEVSTLSDSICTSCAIFVIIMNGRISLLVMYAMFNRWTVSFTI